MIFTLENNTLTGGSPAAIRNQGTGSGRTGVNLIGNTTDDAFHMIRQGTGTGGGTFQYYLRDNTGTVVNRNGRATQVYSPLTR